MRLLEERVYLLLVQGIDDSLREDVAKHSAFVPDDSKWIKEYCVWKIEDKTKKYRGKR